MRDSHLTFLRPNTSFQGRYRVVRRLDAGGMGAVYEVLDERTDARRALKIMLPGLVDDVELRARFAQEARITGSIESEHIVRTMDAGFDEETGTPFLVMELLRGENLRALLARRGPLPPREVVTYLAQAALALEKTHAAGIVHRDLKPENLFLTKRDDGSPCIKILDFGIAKVLARGGGGSTTKSIGTPLYMPPEQATGKSAIGPRADVYALGQIAFTLLVGEAYWQQSWNESAAPLAFLAEVAAGMREPASARALPFGIELRPAFDGWFLKTAAPHPEDRWDCAWSAVEALATALEVQVPTAGSDASARDEARDPARDGLGGAATERASGVGSGRSTDPISSMDQGDRGDHPPVSSPSGTTSVPVSQVPARPRPLPSRPVLVVAGTAVLLGVAALVLVGRLKESPARDVATGAGEASGARSAQASPPSSLVESASIPPAIVPSASVSAATVSAPPASASAPVAAVSAPATARAAIVAPARSAPAKKPPPFGAVPEAPAGPAHERFY